MTDFLDFESRIRSATRCSDLIAVEADLAAYPLARLSEASADYLKEEIRLRLAPVIFTALLRVGAARFDRRVSRPASGIAGQVGDVIEVCGVQALVRAARSGVFEGLADAVEAAWAIERSAWPSTLLDVSAGVMLAAPGMRQCVDVVEDEMAGIFSGVGRVPAAILGDLASCLSESSVGRVVCAIQDSGLADALAKEEAGVVRRRIQERLDVVRLLGAERARVGFRRKARAMGLSLGALRTLENASRRKILVFVIEAVAAALDEDAGNVSGLAPVSSDFAMNVVARLACSGVEEAVADRLSVDAFLASVQTPSPKAGGGCHE